MNAFRGSSCIPCADVGVDQQQFMMTAYKHGTDLKQMCQRWFGGFDFLAEIQKISPSLRAVTHFLESLDVPDVAAGGGNEIEIEL